MDFFGLLPTFGNFAYTVVAFVVALSIIVTVHEYGHYIVGRWSGIYAEVFSLGFGPVLISREDRHGTRWQIAALPFGGYVKFLGDASAVSDKASDALAKMDSDTLRHTMHGAPLWARAATVAAGPVFNFVLSFLIFSIIVFVRGEAIDPPTVGSIKNLPATQNALLPDDTILAIAGQATPDYETFYDVIEKGPVADTLSYRVLRDGAEQDITGPYPWPPLIQGVQPGSAAEQADLKVGDVITAIDDSPIIAFNQLKDIVVASDGRELKLDIWRDGETLQVTLAPRRTDMPQRDGSFETRWLIGMTGGLVFTPKTETPGVIGAMGYGVDQTVFIVKSSVSGLYHMVIGAIGTCNLRGPLGIAQTSGSAASQGIESFIWFVAFLSAAVGFLNLMPIPVLDGGHLVFHAYEAIAGRPPNDNVLRVLMTGGLAILLSLMVFGLSNDLFCP